MLIYFRDQCNVDGNQGRISWGARFIFVFLALLILPAHAQEIDTLIDVGGYKIHFNIIKGKSRGVPILFEAGGGEDATTWKDIIKPIASATGTTLITYDRAGFGKSTFDTTRHGILNGIIGLETGLKKLHYDDAVILVAHSQGGLYATLFASRHPEKVKAMVLIDATTSCFYDIKRLEVTQPLIDSQNKKSKKPHGGSYYQGADFSSNVNLVRKVSIPEKIPVTDLVAERPPFSDQREIEAWMKCHKDFADASSRHKGVIAYGSGHFIFHDNPSLVIDAIVDAFKLTAK